MTNEINRVPILRDPGRKMPGLFKEDHQYVSCHMSGFEICSLSSRCPTARSIPRGSITRSSGPGYTRPNEWETKKSRPRGQVRRIRLTSRHWSSRIDQNSDLFLAFNGGVNFGMFATRATYWASTRYLRF